MSAGITLSCDGLRHGQPCRGALHTRAGQRDEARHVYGKPAGWTSLWELIPGTTTYRALDLCPAAGHDGQEPAP